MLVVKIGGCNGSGKTSLVRAIIEDNNLQPKYTGKKIEAYYGESKKGVPIVVLGSYANVCGGMDTISDKFERLALIERYVIETPAKFSAASQNGIVIFEGLITGKTYGAIGEISDRPSQKGKWLYTFMDTPFEVCVERVLQRRKAAGNEAPFDPERTMRPTYKSCLAVARKAGQQGHHVIAVNHKLPSRKAAAKLLQEVMIHAS